jgi:crossover junction endodeoxyribonuclease RusA
MSWAEFTPPPFDTIDGESVFPPEPKRIRFTVHGTPRPQGSKRHVGNGVMIESSKGLKPWRQEVSGTGIALQVQMIPAHVPLEMTLNFYFTKAKSCKHRAMTKKPDASKLLRAIEDALTGILFYDDSQIIEIHVRKHYGGPDRVEIEVREAIV